MSSIETTGFSSLGVNVSPGASTDQIAASLLELLNSDATFLRASADAVVRAKSWTFSDVAYRLSEWIDRF